MKRIFYLHIGGSKTGSSSLQDFLYLNKQRLIKEESLYYPKNHTKDLSPSLNGQWLKNFLLQKTSLDKIPYQVDKDLTMSLNKNYSIFYSSEELCSAEFFNSSSLENLVTLSKRYNFDKIKILLVLRLPCSWMESTYQEQIKQGHIKSEIEFIKENTSWPHFEALSSLSRIRNDHIDLSFFWFENYRNIIHPIFEEFSNKVDMVRTYELNKLRKNEKISNYTLKICIKTLGKLPFKIEKDDPYFAGRIPTIDDFLRKNNCEAVFLKFQFDKKATDLSFKMILEKYGELVTDEIKSRIENDYKKMRERDEIKDIEINKELESQIIKFINLLAFIRYSEILSNKITNPPKDVDLTLLPPSFNPLGYMIRNPDLLLHNVNPYKHFINSGIEEKRIFS